MKLNEAAMTWTWAGFIVDLAAEGGDKVACTVQSRTPSPFRTRAEIDRYFSGQSIRCLLCGLHFRRLAMHLAVKHDTSADEYRVLFGLPWTRGLTSGASHATSGWTTARKLVAQRSALESQFFKLAHLNNRRRIPPFLKAEAVKNLLNQRTLNAKFERQVVRFFHEGLSDRAIARMLGVGASTVNRRTKLLRAPGPQGL